MRRAQHSNAVVCIPSSLSEKRLGFAWHYCAAWSNPKTLLLGKFTTKITVASMEGWPSRYQKLAFWPWSHCCHHSLKTPWWMLKSKNDMKLSILVQRIQQCCDGPKRDFSWYPKQVFQIRVKIREKSLQCKATNRAMSWLLLGFPNNKSWVLGVSKQ